MSDRPQFLHVPSGAIVFPEGYDPADLQPVADTYWADLDAAEAVAAIKIEAARQIEAVAPLWQQLNDMRQPTSEGDARFAAIDAVRVWSDAEEAKIVVKKGT